MPFVLEDWLIYVCGEREHIATITPLTLLPSLSASTMHTLPIALFIYLFIYLFIFGMQDPCVKDWPYRHIAIATSVC